MTPSAPDQGRGASSSGLRGYNERRILTAIRRSTETSKAELARHIGLSQNAVGLIVADLEKRGLIGVSGRRLGGRGQPATLLRLEASGAYSIGVNVGRRSVTGIVLDFNGMVTTRRQYGCLFPNIEQIIRMAARTIDDLSLTLDRESRRRLIGAGVVIPINTGIWHEEHIPSTSLESRWQVSEVRARIQKLCKLPLFVEHAGTASAISEVFAGAGKIQNDFLYVYINSSVVGSLILDGDIKRGPTGFARDFGTIMVSPSKLSTVNPTDGKPSLLLNRSSGSSLLRHLRSSNLIVSNFAETARYAVLRHRAIEEWLQDCAEALSQPLLTACQILGLTNIVIDGSLPLVVMNIIIDELRPLLGSGLITRS